MVLPGKKIIYLVADVFGGMVLFACFRSRCRGIVMFLFHLMMLQSWRCE